MNHPSRTFLMHLNCCAFPNWTPIQVVFRSNFCAITRLETLATQASHVDNTCAERQKWNPDDHIARHTWSVCGNTDKNEHHFVHFSSMTFLDNACTKIQTMAFKTSQLDQIALEYWYYGFLGRLRVDGRGFLHQKPEQKSRCRNCAEVYHSSFN